MAFRYLRHTALIAILLQCTAAQQKSKVIPQDLQVGFSSSDTALQVTYTNKAVDGFSDGTSFGKDGRLVFIQLPEKRRLTRDSYCTGAHLRPW
jgi:hypothetical protein